MWTPLLLLLLYCAAADHGGAATIISVTDHGAVGDGRCYDTAAIQEAIDECAGAGGGRVRFPAGGDYLTATVWLRTGVVLEVEAGARILGGRWQRDYPADPARWYVVVAEGVQRVGITGGGEINGQGEAFVVRRDPRKNVMVSWNATGSCRGDECRPRLVGFIDSVDVVVSDVTLNQPAYWWCDHTFIRNISIYGDFDSPNNDGIDIEDSNNTFITDSHIDTGDDAICPKSSTGPVHNLIVTDCWIRTKSSAIKLGSASWFDFRRLLFHNITIVDSHRGLAMQIRDGDVLFTNISAVSENGVFLSGSPGGLVSNLKFKDISLTYKRWTSYPGDLYDYRPGCKGMVKHQTAGMTMEHISGLEMENVKMRWHRSNVKGWNNPLWIRPSTVDKLSFKEWASEMC
ncbi:hypothetical protein GW17_00021882 [Ensete ventricosum]|nr:hypothetical protein GW17_00021882 [Ensete ventricosum]